MDNISSLKKKALEALAELEKQNEKIFLISDLNDRLRKEADDHPHDNVIRTMASFLEVESKKQPDKIISQSKFKEWFDKFIGINASSTQAKSVLGDLLPKEEEQEKVSYDSFINGLRDPGEEEVVMFQPDPELTNSLENAFASEHDYYNQDLADKAKENVKVALSLIGHKNIKPRLEAGNSKVLLFSAGLDTILGQKTILIPVLSSGDYPNSFIANGQIVKLNKENVDEFLDNVYVKSELNTNIGAVELPKVAAPKAIQHIVDDMDESLLETAVGYPPASVRVAKQLVLNEFESMGFLGTQVKVSQPTNDGFICKVGLNTPRGNVHIEVPVEMNENYPLIPSVFAKDDFIADLTPENVKSFILQADTNTGLISRASNYYTMDIPELKEIIVKSAANKDFNTCNEVLNVIADRVDNETYAGVVSDYMKILSDTQTNENMLKMAEEDKDQFMNIPTSIYPVHKKLGLPIHKLTRDENGNYHRKATYQCKEENEPMGGFFSNAKVLIGD